MEAAEQVYEGVTHSKNNLNWEYINHASHVRIKKGGGAALSSNTKKGRDGNRRIKNADRSRNGLNRAKICMLHGPGHSTK